MQGNWSRKCISLVRPYDNPPCLRVWFALLFGLGLILGVTAQASGQQPLATAVSESPHNYDLSGVVLNSATGEAIARALITLDGSYSGPPRYVFTELNGQFRFRDVPEGTVTLVARKPGFLEPPAPSRYSERHRLVKVGPKLSPTTLRLIPEGVIFGKVLGADGEPLAGEVRLHYQHVVNGRNRLDPARRTYIDDNGEFRIDDLHSGFYSLAFEPVVRSDEPEPSGHAGYRAAYYPPSSDQDSAKLIEIHPAEKKEINLTLAPEPVYRISGVLDSGDLRNNNCGLQLAHANGDELLVSFWYAPGGLFQAFDVPAGSYVLETKPLYRLEAPVVYLPITVGGNTDNIHATLKPMASIPVIVQHQHLRKASTPPYCRFTDRLRGFSVSVNLISQSRTERDGFTEWEGRGENRGPVVHARPGRYAAEIIPDDDCGWFVQSATYRNTDLLHEDLLIPDRADAEPIQVVLQDNIGKLTVRVQSETNERPTAVLLIPEGTTSATAQVQWALPRANVEWESVPPGNYSLYAFDEIDDLDYTNPDALSAYSSKAVRFELHPDEEKSIAMQVIMRGEP